MVSQSVSLEESLLSEAYQLGQPAGTYQTQVTRSGWLVVLVAGVFVFLFIGGLIVLFIWGMLPLISNPYFPPSPILIVSLFVMPLFLLFCVFAFIWQLRNHNLLTTPLRRKIIVALYNGGFIYQEGRKRQVVVWEELRFIDRLAIKRWNTPLLHYTLKLTDASDILLPTIITNVRELGERIEQKMIQRLLPEVLADYAQDRPVVFPGLCLNQHSVNKSDESLSWREVEQITLGIEKISIKEKGNARDWLSLPCAQVHNACLLEALLKNISEEKSLNLVIE
jgi:heme/copper-type cytochrome/quinol oxidase subunit 2